MVNKPFFTDSTPHMFAHRGGNAAGRKKENTIVAFRSAVDLGYSYLEIDVIVTKDGQVVTYHGSRTNTEAKKIGLATRKHIQSLTYQEVQQQVASGGEPVPLLKDVLDSFSQAKFSIDVKTREVIAPFAGVIQETKSLDRICVASFSRKRLLEAAELLGGAKEVALAYCVHPRLSWLLKVSPGLCMSWFAQNKIDCLHVHSSGTTPKVLQAAKKRNIKVYVWTVNSKDAAERYKKMGVDGIITDETKLLSINTM